MLRPFSSQPSVTCGGNFGTTGRGEVVPSLVGHDENLHPVSQADHQKERSPKVLAFFTLRNGGQEDYFFLLGFGHFSGGELLNLGGGVVPWHC